MARPAEPVPHLLHVFSTFAVGGPQTRFVSIANALGRKYRHTVLAMDGNDAAAAGLTPDVECAIEPFPTVKSATISLANVRAARRLLRRLRPDLLVTYNWGAIEWSLANWRRGACRQVHIEDGFGPDEAVARQNPRRAIARRLLLSRCEKIIVPSLTLYDIATRRWRIAPRRVLYLPNGIDCQRFAAPPDAALLAQLGIAPGVPLVGTVAALRREKNLPRLLRAFAAMPAPAMLMIVGDGPERAALAAAAARLAADRVVFTGALANPERLLARFDVFALSSDTEQMPNSVLEAMAAGRPVVATDVGDVKRMLAPENAAFVVPPGDEDAFARALRALLQDGAGRARLGRANQDRVRADYSLETMVARYDALFSGGDDDGPHQQ